MPLTLAEARNYLHEFITPNGPMDSLVLSTLNDVQERFINSGHWVGDKAIVTFNAPAAYITLPRRFQSILGVRFDTRPRSVYSQYHTFQECGPGELSDSAFTMSGLVDLGPGFATYLDLSEDCDLSVRVEDAGDYGKTIWIKGIDSDDRIIYNSSGVEGISTTTAAGYVDITNYDWSAVTGFIKPVTEDYVNLYQLVDGVRTQIGAYEPGETVADYRRYQLGNYSTQRPDAIVALCKRKFIPAISETDLIYPDNKGALKLACMSLNYETQNDLQRAEEYWQKALQTLNLQTRQSRGAAQQRLNVSPHGLSFGRIRRTR